MCGYQLLQHVRPLEIDKELPGRLSMTGTAHERNGVRDQKRLFRQRLGNYGRALALFGSDVMGIGQSDPRFAVSDLFCADRVAIDEKRFVRRQRATPILPSLITPTLPQRQK